MEFPHYFIKFSLDITKKDFYNVKNVCIILKFFVPKDPTHMPIDPAEITRLKTTTDLSVLVESCGVVLKPHGRDLVGRCPFHEDRTPSLVVTPEKGLWNCLGACGEGGDAIRWVEKREGLPFPEACKWLSKWLGNGHHEKSPSPIKLPISPQASDQALLNAVISFYHQNLLQDPAPREYLKSREIYSEEIIKKFKLGFANRNLGKHLPPSPSKEGKEIRDRLCELGIMYGERRRELFEGSLIIPVLDEEGNVLEIYGRKLHQHLRKGTNYHLYLPGPHKGLWNPECLKEDTIILCESLIDALTFYIHGFTNVTTSY